MHDHDSARVRAAPSASGGRGGRASVYVFTKAPDTRVHEGPDRTSEADPWAGGQDGVRFIPSELEEPRKRVLFVTNMWPDEERPSYGTFIGSQGRSLEQLGIAVDVLYVRGYARKSAYLEALPLPA